jgi:multiple sugar transport system substrate-binding protein
MADRRVHELAGALYRGRIDRRDFVRGMTALGVSATAINLFLRGAAAQDNPDGFATPDPEGLKPPTVAQPCEGDGCWGAGREITLQVIDASVKVPVDEVRGEFEAATGAKLTVIADPIESAFTKLIDDATNGSNSYDGAMIAMQWLGELAEGEFVLPVDEFRDDASGKFPSYDLDTEPESLRQLRFYGGQQYVIPMDCDGQVLYYRRDLLTDEGHQQAFSDEYGYEMPVPPQTWEQVLDIAKYFNGKENDSGGTLNGISLHLKVGGQGMYHYASLSAPYVIGPENPNLYWFDPDTMDPLCTSAGHVKAANLLKEIFQLGPEAMAGWALGEAWDYFLKGNAVFTYSWGDVTPLAIEQSQPTVGKLGAVQLPGSLAYTNPLSGEEFAVDSPNIVGNTTGGSWSGVVMAETEHADLVYYLWALLATEPKQRFMAARGTDGVDPARSYQIPEPVGTGNIDDYTAQGWDPKDAEEYTKAFFDNFSNPLQLPYLRIPGAERYWSAMDIRLSEFMTNQVGSAEEALANMAEDWNEITDMLDRETQKASYRTSLGLE